MAELVCTIPVPSTHQELDRAVRFYQNADLSGNDLFCYWQAIRDAAIAQPEEGAENERCPGDERVPGEDSY